jgi:hypothetical protein
VRHLIAEKLGILQPPARSPKWAQCEDKQHRPELAVEDRVDILRCLLHMARRGLCGAVYCDDPWLLRLGVGPRSYGETVWITWDEAAELAAKWIDRKPMERAVVASTKRVEQSQGAQSRKRA